MDIKKKKAAVLKYGKDDVSPRVVAMGKGYVADKILNKGKESNLPVYQDAKLADELLNMDLGESIPPELYEIVAQILTFISDLDRLQEMRSYGDK